MTCVADWFAWNDETAKLFSCAHHCVRCFIWCVVHHHSDLPTKMARHPLETSKERTDPASWNEVLVRDEKVDVMLCHAESVAAQMLVETIFAWRHANLRRGLDLGGGKSRAQ